MGRSGQQKGPTLPGAFHDQYSDINKLKNALDSLELESSNLILGIDFTKSNQWTGKSSFYGDNLHKISPNKQNPYEHAMSIIWKAMSEYDEDNKIPCFGFGDASTHDQKVFSFYGDGRPCVGIEGVLERYRKLVPYLIFSGPTSFAPIIYAAIDVVRKSGGQYHILVIIADGQVTGNTAENYRGRLSFQERATMDALISASSYPLSIVLVGVGDGPWDTMQVLDDAVPKRKFDNFQFVNYTEIMSRTHQSEESKENAFALEALMEIPQQYNAIKYLQNGGLPRHRFNKAVIVPPPIP